MDCRRLQKKKSDQAKRCNGNLLSLTKLQGPLSSETRSSPDFWRLKEAELMCLIQQLDIPTFFLTYSPAETSWFEVVRALIFFDNRRRGIPGDVVTDHYIRRMSRARLTDLLPILSLQ